MNSVTVIDGGFATQLGRVTGDDIDGDPLWSARYLSVNPEAVLQTHLDFLNAGAEVIITNSYQASIAGFMKYLGLNEESSYELIKESVRIARRAVDKYMKAHPNAKRPKIAGSVGPYGAFLHNGSEYTGSYIDEVPMDSILKWHEPRIKALLEEEVDLLAIETIPCLAEAEGLLNLMKRYPEQKFWLSFQCKDDKHTAHGESFKEAVEKCWKINSSQLVAIGCNCLKPNLVRNLISSVNQDRISKIPLVVYPNSGEEYSVTTGWSGGAHSDNFIQLISDWLNLGVAYIGGCCRTDADLVSDIWDAVNSWSTRKT